MKLRVIFSSVSQFTIDWDKPFDNLAQDFPTYVILDNEYYEFGMYSFNAGGNGFDAVLHFGRIAPNAIPCDMFGNQFPVVDFREKFNLTVSKKECECGSKHTDFPDSHMLFCPLWKKFEATP